MIKMSNITYSKKLKDLESKGQVLKNLQTILKKSNIEKLYIIKKNEWNKNSENIINYIQKEFNEKIIVRSSARGEDSEENSQAGVFDSILNVNSKSKIEIKNAINKVIKSYEIAGNLYSKNEILVQKQTTKILFSGVIFSRIPNSGAPYYIINYDESENSDTVTHGKVNNTIKIFHNTMIKKLDNQWGNLIIAVKEIESILCSDYLDIEFAITKNYDVTIFQVRPITSIPKKVNNKIKKLIQKKIIENKRKFLKKSKSKKVLPLKSTIFSDMTDWNPAEIIGNNPNLLDFSLYDYLIMKKNWEKGRQILDYQDVNPYHLMQKFGNKPYVDIKGSFNSLIPKNIPSKLRGKLVNFYFKKLKENPQLLDKVEFEILFTCYDLTMDERLKELKDNGFSNTEIIIIKKCLVEFTNNIIKKFPKIMEDSIKSINKMQVNREKILKDYNSNEKNFENSLLVAEKLLLDCKKLGTLPFSVMARIAFMASAILRSLEKKKIMNSKTKENLMNSIRTPLIELQEDLELLHYKKISTQIFNKNMVIYAQVHMISQPYATIKKTHFFDNLKFIDKKKKTSIINKHKINSKKEFLLKPLVFENINVIDFIKKSLSLREMLKFEFTRNLSDSIELIANALNELGFSRHDVKHLEIDVIFSNYKKMTKKELQKYLKKKIVKQKEIMEINNYLVLPPLIFSEEDFEIIKYHESKPNFITTKSISSDTVNISKNTKYSSIENKIVIIENADPGYDWIFTKNPMGLITKYGGIASHMAIRCAEIGLPAAIGCGNIIYDNISFAKKIMLDCKNEQIIVLENEKENAYLEEKKILKSLGYIK